MNGVKSTNYLTKLYNFFIVPIRNFSIIWQIIIIYMVFLTCLFTFSIVMHIYYYQVFMKSQNDETYYNQMMRKTLLNQSDQYVEYLQTKIVYQTLLPIKNIIFCKIFFLELQIHGLVLNDKSILTDITSNFTSKTSSNLMSFSNNTLTDFEIKDEDLIHFNYDEKYHLKVKGLDYYIGDLAKLYYFIYPIIYCNFLFNKVKINSGFFTAYSVEVSELEINRNSEYQNANFSGVYFQYPIEKSYIKSKGLNFRPADYYTDPVPFLLSKNVPNFNYTNNWLTNIDRKYLLENTVNKEDGIFRTISISTTDTFLNKVEKIIPVYVTSGKFIDVKIFFSIGYKIYKDDLVNDLMAQYDYFGIINSYGESNITTYKNDFLKNINSFQYFNYSNSDKINDTTREYLQYYSFDDSRSTFFKSPNLYKKIYDNSLFPMKLNNTFLKFNINPPNMIDLLNYNLNFDVNISYQNDVFFYFFVYSANLYSYFVNAKLNIKNIKSSEVVNSPLYDTCYSTNFPNYIKLLNQSTTFNCFSDDSLDNLAKFKNKNSNYLNYNGNLVNCYCVGLLCLDLTNKTFMQNFTNFLPPNTFLNETKLKDLKIPNECSISLSTKSMKSGLSTYRVITKETNINLFNFSNFVNIYIVDDFIFNNVYSFYENSSYGLVFSIFYIYLGLLVIILLFFVNLAKGKLNVLKDKLEYLSKAYLEMINKTSDLEEKKIQNLKNYSSLNVGNINPNKCEEFGESDLFMRRNKTSTKVKIKKKQSIYNFKIPNLTKLDIISNNRDIETFDEIDDVFNILKDNIDIFKIEFNLEKTYNLKDRFIEPFNINNKMNQKLIFLFQNNAEFLKKNYGKNFYTLLSNDEVLFTQNVILELSLLKHYDGDNFSRNFLFRFCKYDENDSNVFFKKISTFKKEQSKYDLLIAKSFSTKSNDNIEFEVNENFVRQNIYHMIDNLI